jgi:hypothetical protein
MTAHTHREREHSDRAHSRATDPAPTHTNRHSHAAPSSTSRGVDGGATAVAGCWWLAPPWRPPRLAGVTAPAVDDDAGGLPPPPPSLRGGLAIRLAIAPRTGNGARARGREAALLPPPPPTRRASSSCLCISAACWAISQILASASRTRPRRSSASRAALLCSAGPDTAPPAWSASARGLLGRRA